MKISVVTVCYNAAKTIGHTLESFLSQSHTDKELIIIDGQSTDDTIATAIARAVASDRVIIHSEPDSGMYDAANKGLARFSGDAVGFLNADDRFHDGDALAKIASGLADADIVFGGVDFVTNHDDRHVVRRWQGTPFGKGSFRRGWMPAHPSFYVRRAVAEAVGSFDLSYRIASDYEWMLRACELRYVKTKLIENTLVDMMMGGASTAGLISTIKHNLEAQRARRHWMGSGMVDSAMFAKPLRKVGQYFVREAS